MFRIGRNTFYDRKNEIPMKIPYFKRSGIRIIGELRRIPNRFPRQGPKSHLALSHNLSCYDSISTSPVPKSHLVCPIVRLIMTQYQLLLSQKVNLLCSVIHLVMTLYQLLLPHLVRSCFIIVKIMFSSNYWC